MSIFNLRADRSGMTRTAEAGSIGSRCPFGGTCESNNQEYRISARVDDGPRTFVWVEQSDFEVEVPDYYEVDTIWLPLVYWWDYPHALFDTNERRSFRLDLPGLARASATDGRGREAIP